MEMLETSRVLQNSSPKPRVGIVTVTYNSGRFFDRYMSALDSQTVPPDLVVIIDSGSSEPGFLSRVSAYGVRTMVRQEANIGVCAGNNMGWRELADFDYVVFVNPDAFLPEDFVQVAVSYMEEHKDVGMVTPTLLRYDIESQSSLGVIDSTGVVRNWLGSTEERDNGKPITALERYRGPNEIPWVCTAVALGRNETMLAVAEKGSELFDESFFMYKDDTDLSWRVRRAGWKLVHLPALVGYHCRGWQDRKSISRKARLQSVRNETRMCVKNRSPFVLVAGFKYLLVRLFNV